MSSDEKWREGLRSGLVVNEYISSGGEIVNKI